MSKWIEENKTLTKIIFWGGLILLICLLSGLHDNTPDLSNPPDDYPLEQYCGPGGTPC